MNNKKITLLIIAAILIFSFSFFAKRVIPQNDPNKIKITTSFYPYYFFASRIGGDKVNVINITPPGAEPHDYDLTSGDIVNIQTSKALIINGQVEPWKKKITKDLSDNDVKLVETSDNLFTLETIDETGTLTKDPHVWLNPKNAKEQVLKIADTLVAVDTKNEEYYRSNANKLNIELDKLYIDYSNGLATCTTRDIITTHAAFAYLAAEFRLKQVSITGLSPEEEPSLKKLSEISDFAKKNNVKYIFFESLVSPKLANTIASEIGAQTLVLNPIEGLTPEELSQGQNYFTVMNDNLKNLKIALNCK